MQAHNPQIIKFYDPQQFTRTAGSAAMIGTWGYYETNENGQAVAFAPAMTGDINITESDTTPGEYTIDYVLTDDNIDEPHTIESLL